MEAFKISIIRLSGGLRILFVISVFALLFSCNKEIITPEPPPPPPPVEEIDSLIIEPVLKIQGYSSKTDRLGAGDYSCDTLFYLSNLPLGRWDYSLDLGGSIQVGTLEVESETVKIANDFKEAAWLQFIADDSITLHLSLYSDDYIMERQTHSFIFENEPYRICTWQDLQSMCYDLKGDYRLQNDIIFPERATGGFPEQGFIPVGTAGPASAFLLNSFQGTLNGYGYKIKNFIIDRADLNYVGLFGVLADATIKDLIIEVGPHGIVGGNYVGAVAGYVARKSVIENCKVLGNISGLNQVGGVAGELDIHSVITLSRTNGEVLGNDNVGGLVGIAQAGSSISTSFVVGSVSGNNYSGGLVGYNRGVISNSQTGDELVISQIQGVDFVAGLCAYNNGEILGCRVINSNIEGKNNLGGMLGYADILSYCKESCSKVSVKGESKVGGLIGYNLGKIHNSYALGTIAGDAQVGGLVGEFYSEVLNSYSSADVAGISSTSSGAFAGSNNGTISGCYFDKDRAIPKRAVGLGSDFGVEERSKEQFENFSALEIPRQIFMGWDFASVWENEVPLISNKRLPGLKREFNFE